MEFHRPSGQDQLRRSGGFAALDRRSVNLNGFVYKAPELGFVAMHLPHDLVGSLAVKNRRMVELDGKAREAFDRGLSSPERSVAKSKDVSKPPQSREKIIHNVTLSIAKGL